MAPETEQLPEFSDNTPATGGGLLKSTCAVCGHSVSSHARYCGRCGAPLARQASVNLSSSDSSLDPSTTSYLLPGTVLGANARYRVERLLDRGGFGEAYLALDVHLNRHCVIKCVITDLAQGDDERRALLEQFEREAQLLVTLNTPGHPNIPEIYEYLPGEHCLIMKYIQGKSLAEVLRQRGGPLPEQEALRYACDVCSALVYMHSHHPEPILHRDIKPANILLGDDGRIWVIDFGLSKVIPAEMIANNNLLSQLAGTVGYTAPEQWLGGAEPRSDVYSLAVTLHTLLTNYQPLLPQVELRDVILGYRLPVPPARQINQEIRPAVEQIIHNALVVDVATRPSSAAFLAELDLLRSREDAQLPPEPQHLPEVSDFVGRTTELEYFSKKLATGHLAVIVGPAGVGKTALASKLARRAGTSGQIFWHTFHKDEGVDSIIWNLAAFLAWNGQGELWQQLQSTRQAGVQPLPDDIVLSYLVQMLRGRDYLLCFDDVHFIVDDPQLDQLVDRLRDEVRGGRVSLILASRQTLEFVQSAEFAPLGGLNRDDARDLLAKRELLLPDSVIDEVIATTEGNAQLLLLSVDAIRQAPSPTKVIARLVDTEDVETYLLTEVDQGLAEEQRTVMWAISVFLRYPATQAAIEALLEPSDEGLLQDDEYASYEAGLRQLLTWLPKDHPRYSDLLVFEQRLIENIKQSRLFGDTPTQDAERAEVIDQLNRLALETLHESFNSLGGTKPHMVKLQQIGPVRDLRRILRELRRRNLLVTSSTQEREYAQHALVQSFYYNGLERQERLELHRRAGRYYEREQSDTLKAARHFQQAGDYTHAADLLTADVWALINEGQAQPLRLLLDEFKARALDANRWITVCIARGEVGTLLGYSESAQAAYLEALERLAALPAAGAPPTLYARACRSLGVLLEYQSPQEALVWLRRGLEKLAGSNYQEEAILHLRIGSALIAIGSFAEARVTLDQSLHLLSNEPSQWRADALTNLGVVYCSQGDMGPGQQCFEEALTIYRATGNQWGMISILQNIGMIKEIAGDWARARQEYEQARELAARLGGVSRQAALELCLGNLNAKQGDLETAQAHLTRCLELAHHHGLKEYLIHTQSSLADLWIRQAQWQAAEPLLREAERLAQEMEHKYQLSEIYRGWAQVRLGRAEPQQALEAAERSVALAQELGAELEEGMSLRILGQVLLANNRREEALAAFAQSLSHLDGRDPYEAARTRGRWGAALRSGGDDEHGVALLQEARTALAGLGAQRDLAGLDMIAG
jgi:serine/threonine protein kinase